MGSSVKRNPERFPDDFMFKLNADEVELVGSQSVIPSKKLLGGALPFAFTEQGVASLSSVLQRPTYERVRDTHKETRIKASEKMSEKTPDRILRLVSSNHDITIAELAQAIGVTPRTIERNIKKLQSQGRLKRVGPDKGGYWNMINKKKHKRKKQCCKTILF